MHKPMSVVLAAALSCTPVPAPCSPSSCAGGCCDVRGVCVAGRTTIACGLTGAACAICEGGQQCLSGLCAVPQADAGLEPDAGDAGEQALADAGPLRTVVVRSTVERLLADGGAFVEVLDPHLLGVGLQYQRDGAWVTAMPSSLIGPELVFDAVPEGPYLVRRGVDIIQASAAELDVGFRSVGRRAGFVAPGTPLTVAVSNVVPGLRSGDSLALTSLNAGAYLDTYTIPQSTPDASVGQWAIDYGTLTSWNGSLSGALGDEVTVVLRRTSTTDAGVVRVAQLVASVPAPEYETGRPATITALLQPVAGARAFSVEARFSDFVQYLGDVSPTAVFTSASLAVAAVPLGRPASGGRFDGRTAQLFETFVTGAATDLRAPIEVPDVFPGTEPLFEARIAASVTYSASGRSLTTPLEVMRTGRVDGGVLGLEVSPVRFVRINGQTANVARNGVGVTPLLEWSAPAVGTPNRFLVVLWRLTPQGTTFTQSFVGRITATEPRVRVPPELLRPGEAYYALVIASVVPAVDTQRRPFHENPEQGRATAATAPFTP